MIAGIRARLGELRRREIAQGANVLGPHRDDLAFLAGGMDISTYGSRGQQRSVALALKLAELDYIEHETGDQPILLLDDVLSELDSEPASEICWKRFARSIRSCSPPPIPPVCPEKRSPTRTGIACVPVTVFEQV